MNIGYLRNISLPFISTSSRCSHKSPFQWTSDLHSAISKGKFQRQGGVLGRKLDTGSLLCILLHLPLRGLLQVLHIYIYF